VRPSPPKAVRGELLRIVEAGFLKAECLPDDQPTVLKY